MTARSTLPTARRHPLDFPGSQAAILYGEVVEVLCAPYPGEVIRREVHIRGIDHSPWPWVHPDDLYPIGPVACALLGVLR
jgi:hypothetical protein